MAAAALFHPSPITVSNSHAQPSALEAGDFQFSTNGSDLGMFSTGSGGAGAFFGSSEPQASQHQSNRDSIGSQNSSIYTDPTSMSEGGESTGAGVPGGRKMSYVQGMKRARSTTNTAPYALRQGSVSGSDYGSVASSDSRRSSVVSNGGATSDAEEELGEMIRRGSVGPAPLSREGSIHSDWGDPAAGQYASPAGSATAPMVDPVTGMMMPAQTQHAGGSFVDSYGQQHQQSFVLGMPPHSYGQPMHPGMMSDMSMGGVHMGGMHGYGSMAPPMMNGSLAPAMMGGAMPPPGVPIGGVRMATLNPVATMGGAAAQMSRMSLDSSEAYEALAHHIRSAVTTSAADRARQAFVQAWLNSSYMAYTDGNVSRQGLYGSYLRICQQYDIKPINAASFGKAVRQCFPNIKTRRLGVRGNSKYHYCGIRPASAREAEILITLSRSEQPEPAQSGQNSSAEDADEDSDAGGSMPLTRHRSESSHLEVQAPPLGAYGEGDGMPQTPLTARPRMNLMAGGGEAKPTGFAEISTPLRPMPLPSLDEALAMAGPSAETVDVDAAKTFWEAFGEHAKMLVDVVRHLRFDQFELQLRTFWAGLDASGREVAQHPVITALIYRADAVIYDEILDYLHSQVLVQMPPAAFTALTQLARSMEQVIIVALESFPSNFVSPKIELAARFGHLIIRHLGICQLAGALATVFSSPTAVREMLLAWDSIDFEAVRNQAALVTSCQHEVLGHCLDDFRCALADPHANIEGFIRFVESTYERCLLPTPDGERAPSPRSLLVRWCYVCSQILRDLTLRSAPAFGSFQIVSLFFEEWLGFKVLRKVALHVAAVPATAATGVPGQRVGSDGTGLVPLYDMSSGLDNEMGFMFSPNTANAFAAAQEQLEPRSSDSSPHRAGSEPGPSQGSPDDQLRQQKQASEGFEQLMDVSAFGAAMNEHSGEPHVSSSPAGAASDS